MKFSIEFCNLLKYWIRISSLSELYRSLPKGNIEELKYKFLFLKNSVVLNASTSAIIKESNSESSFSKDSVSSRYPFEMPILGFSNFDKTYTHDWIISFLEKTTLIDSWESISASSLILIVVLSSTKGLSEISLVLIFFDRDSSFLLKVLHL